MLSLRQQAAVLKCRQGTALAWPCRVAGPQPRCRDQAAASISSVASLLPTGTRQSRRTYGIVYAAETMDAQPEQLDAPAAEAAAAEGGQPEKKKGGKRRRYVKFPAKGSSDEAAGAETKDMLPRGWFADPSYTAAALYEELLKRCEANETELGPLYQMCKLTTTPDEARITLNAFAAVRAARVRNGKTDPFPNTLNAAFVEAIRESDSADVLVEALQRATELGLACSSSSINRLLKVWGARNELPKVEQVIAAMPLGGALYTTETAYVIIRTALSVGQKDKAEYYANAMRERQVRLSPSTERLLTK